MYFSMKTDTMFSEFLAIKKSYNDRPEFKSLKTTRTSLRKFIFPNNLAAEMELPENPDAQGSTKQVAMKCNAQYVDGGGGSLLHFCNQPCSNCNSTTV